jgi:hypothetical protein
LHITSRRQSNPDDYNFYAWAYNYGLKLRPQTANSLRQYSMGASKEKHLLHEEFPHSDAPFVAAFQSPFQVSRATHLTSIKEEQDSLQSESY